VAVPPVLLTACAPRAAVALSRRRWRRPVLPEL
jgi:hypothetical protein